ncbi:MAG: hypothetical protein RR356_06180 [Bacteroidales bacterium]
MKRIFWKGYCHQERIKAIYDIENIINRYGAIIDFKKFSDMALTLLIEVDGDKTEALYIELKQYLNMDDYNLFPTQQEISIFFNITFWKGKGDLVIETPAVPG